MISLNFGSSIRCMTATLAFGVLFGCFSNVKQPLLNNDSITANTIDQVLPSTSSAKQLLSVAQVESDVSLARKAYERIHPGYTRYTEKAELDHAWQSIINQAQSNQGMAVGELYLSIQKALTLIHCDHTKANLSKPMAQERNQTPMYLPFRWVWLENRAIISQVADQAALELDKDDEIIAIDGRSIQSLVEEVLPYIPFDGQTHWSRHAGVTESLEFMGGAIDHFGALLWEIKPDVSLTVKTEQGQLKDLKIKRINYRQSRALARQHSSAENFKDAVEFKLINQHTAYLKVDTFVNYRQPVKPDSIYTPIFKAIKNKQIRHLILDLRQNGGGSSDASLGLFAHLINHPRQAKTDMRVNTLKFDDIRPYLWTWDKRALNPNPQGFSKNNDGTYSLREFVTDELKIIEPAKYAFEGKIIALTSRENSSGSTNLLANLKTQGNVILVGEKTGGSVEGVTAGVLFTLTLPESKITTRIPFFRYRNNTQASKRGMGILPDINAQMTVDAYLADKDPALEQALSIALNAN